jgi:GNAT superfamily N-acetyltransferase
VPALPGPDSQRYTSVNDGLMIIMDSDVVQAQTDADYSSARVLFEEYAAQLGVDLGFQGFAAELEQLPTMYGAPGGCLCLARMAGASVGCVGVRRWSADSCEMKRLYVRDAARGGGVGHSLVLAAINSATAMGYQRMLLDTLADMRGARRLYAAFGFRGCEPYRHNPVPGTTFMALTLTR